jgi:hypothetical protein
VGYKCLQEYFFVPNIISSIFLNYFLFGMTMERYATAVRSVSQGAASYSLEFSRFGLVPNNEQSRILKEHGIFIREEKKEEEEE